MTFIDPLVFTRSEHSVLAVRHIAILAVLDAEGAMGTTRLMQALGIPSKGSVTRLVQNLAKRGLAVNEATHRDKRKRRIALTPEGRALIASAQLAA